MTCPDENVKRLKEMIDYNNRHNYKQFTWQNSEIEALLSRLEAAEKVCQSVIDNGDEDIFKFSMKVWRKAAGK